MIDDVKSLLLNIADIDELKNAVNKELESGTDPLAIIESMNSALTVVGEKYDCGNLFLSELIMIGNLASEITDMLKPFLEVKGEKTSYKIGFGTVKGDIHDIGKNIVIMLLRASRYEVIDLGVDVSVTKFVEFVADNNPDVLCMSSLLTSTMLEMKKVVEALDRAGLRDDVCVIVGGRPITKSFAEEIGADGYAKDAITASRVIKGVIEGGKKN